MGFVRFSGVAFREGIDELRHSLRDGSISPSPFTLVAPPTSRRDARSCRRDPVALTVTFKVRWRNSAHIRRSVRACCKRVAVAVVDQSKFLSSGAAENGHGKFTLVGTCQDRCCIEASADGLTASLLPIRFLPFAGFSNAHRDVHALTMAIADVADETFSAARPSHRSEVRFTHAARLIPGLDSHSAAPRARVG